MNLFDLSSLIRPDGLSHIHKYSYIHIQRLLPKLCLLPSLRENDTDVTIEVMNAKIGYAFMGVDIEEGTDDDAGVIHTTFTPIPLPPSTPPPKHVETQSTLNNGLDAGTGSSPRFQPCLTIMQASKHSPHPPCPPPWEPEKRDWSRELEVAPDYSRVPPFTTTTQIRAGNRKIIKASGYVNGIIFLVRKLQSGTKRIPEERRPVRPQEWEQEDRETGKSRDQVTADAFKSSYETDSSRYYHDNWALWRLPGGIPPNPGLWDKNGSNRDRGKMVP